MIPLIFYLFLVILVPGKDSTERPTAFFSQMVNRQIVYGYNHLAYCLLSVTLAVAGGCTLKAIEVESFIMGIFFWVTLVLTLTFLINFLILLYGVCTNTTPS